ncbi:hypothetical protein AKJ09_09354 [Labilithrix luteola]|uniref:Type IV fimbrial biogenesis protein PilY1 n=1 Tax=Labilithrix luteola TaxID=1391654 RepID=A0A0K1QA72_9BACT|nr:hypothetical protein [Labilithrix luteola]AKV02691.1 hypothetical protein AKJ09_09354 [Labilithrix luteola]
MRRARVIGGSLIGMVVALLGGAIVACASDSSEPTATGPDGQAVLPSADATTDSDADAANADAGCGACAPVDCTTTDFCPVTLPTSPTVALNAIWGSSSNDLWIAGSQGTILHGDGVSFTTVDWSGGADARDTIFFSAWGISRDDVWFGATGAPLRRSRDRQGNPVWERVTGAVWNEDSASQGRVAAIWGAPKGGVWLAGNPSSRFGGYGSFWLEGVDTESNSVWIAVPAYEGTNMAMPSIRALWGSGPNDVWAAGDGGKIFRYVPAADDAPASWSGVNSFTTVPLEGLWGSSASDLWAVGADGALRHFTGDVTEGFAAVASPTTRALHGASGSSASDVWAVGDHGTILHFDGKAWSLATTGLAIGQTPNLFAVWASGVDDVWIAGQGVLLHRTGSNRRQP